MPRWKIYAQNKQFFTCATQIICYINNMKEKFTFEVTDTFGGEANYCWVHKHEIEAKSLHGALCILSRIEGLNFRSVGCDRYDAKGACICAFLIEEYWN